MATLKAKESSPLKILHSILDGAIIPIFNDEIIDEYREVLHRPKFQFLSILGVHSDRIKSEDICNDPEDVVFYEVTLSVDEAYLITGNIKHFPVKPIIVTPAQMIEILLAAAAIFAAKVMVNAQGKFETVELKNSTLHVYYSNDVMADASYIVEGKDALVVLEAPLFKKTQPK